jgi:hypothetical protein
MPATFRRPATAAAVLAVIVLLAGCSAAPSELSDPPPLSHIHALSVEPTTQDLLVATHEGIFQLTIAANGAAHSTGPLGGLDFDAMGYTVRDGIAYASGHPGPTTPATFGRPNLGLITSTDGAQTWTNVSLTGQTDFHSLAVLPPVEGSSDARVFGIDSATQVIQRSLDGGRSWTSGANLAARDLLATSSGLYATTENGLALSVDNGDTFTVDAAAPTLYVISADPATDGLVGIDVAGDLWATDRQGEWHKGGAVTGTPQALTANNGGLYIADDRGITFTDTLGATWTEIRPVTE